MKGDLTQIRILHVSDLHLGDTHRFQPDLTPDADRPAGRGHLSLASSIRSDLDSLSGKRRWLDNHTKCPLIVAATGDLTDNASSAEFQRARTFFDEIYSAPIVGSPISPETTFVVPGNHDVIYDEPDVGRRWFPYCDFYQDLFSHTCRPQEAYRLCRVRDLSEKLRIVVVELNTAFDVRKGSPDEKRGHVSAEDIDRIRDELDAIPKDRLGRAVRIAIMHHHPVVLPALAEPGRGYDAVVNAQALLAVLRDFGFHLVLHGHKHFPHAFSYDPICAWTLEPGLPLMIVSGGSAGSRGLPDADGATNTYNAIAVKWDPVAHHARIVVETRGLVRHDDRRLPLTPARWYWKTLRTVDRVLANEPPTNAIVPSDRLYSPTDDALAQKSREDYYRRTRGNMLVASVYPSLEPDQCYEVRVCIVPHHEESRELPIRVEWSCGPNFRDVVICHRDEDKTFQATISYWGSMLVCATMYFEDETKENVHIYAHLPAHHSEQPAPG